MKGAGLLRRDYLSAMVVQALQASGKRRKSVPVFDWSGEELELKYEKK